jgi:hypothetical protein
MGHILTRAEINASYDGEWVMVGDPDVDDQMEVQAGTVLCHNRDRDEFDRETLALEPRPKRVAVLFLGKMPEHVLLNL